jgi:NACHT domain
MLIINITDVIDGALVNAIALAGRRISMAAGGLRSRRRADDVSAARWFDTYSLTGTPPQLPGLSVDLTQRLAGVLEGYEFQAALQELLAVRLTDAPEVDAIAARQVLIATLIANAADAASVGDVLTEYYDDQICALVTRLEADDPPLLAQIRSDAFSTRMINVLNAIERHTAALTTRPALRTEANFLSRYRRHVVTRHGELEPPDFDRRRRVPIADIYVPTTITEDPPPGRAPAARAVAQPTYDVYGLAEQLDRSVLLGDPGGGKTTAANVLMHHFAADPQGRVPFLVTLREYASGDSPQLSVVAHIERVLDGFYQIPPPAGLVELLMLTGRAVVIFDGLDELLDVGRRADVTGRVEHFCVEYPLVPVLVTSRVVGYDQARLDDRQFLCYRLGGFGDPEVAEYVRKWFRQDADARVDDAATFLAESASVRDLRSNPLLLSLMCILYRGEGSLPRDRAEVYQQCADLLFRRWDARRDIHQGLRAGHLLEPVLRNVAWSLFARNAPQPTMRERDLIDHTAGFLQSRGFESEDDARSAAGEIVEFCRGRMWVFTDAGTEPGGGAGAQRLYAFTHRTFLEYFAASQLAYSKDSPEQLATALIPYIVRRESWVVAELALQIKDRTSDRGAPRIYATLLGERRGHSEVTLQFLALCLRSVDPSPQYVRELTRQLFTATSEPGRDLSPDSSLRSAWRELTSHRGTYHGVIVGEIDAAVARAVGSGREDLIVRSLRLMLSLRDALPLSPEEGANPDREAWAIRADSCLTAHRPAAIGAAQVDAYVRQGAIRAGLISVRQALDMPGAPAELFRPSQGAFRECAPYFGPVLFALGQGWPAFGQAIVAADLEAFGSYLIGHREPPWLDMTAFDTTSLLPDSESLPDELDPEPPPLNPIAYLGAAVLLLVMEEARFTTVAGRRLGSLGDLDPYLSRRRGLGRRTGLPDLMVPEEFKQAFRDWAEGRLDATGLPGAPNG